ncbi:uncharacterized protein B0P05DRAFT_594994 [Gilbertella persicaria]|uniref:uncharacterized protein n=1 Tax=Gilbertella persicaria TaxID=101096 RepID=UPI002220675D|nr:uncharacterized protein B0P05DRAFT_594994 [Gilbertella persicaria]KAI8087763.1 hypothetical protein B0P05DRAFT_594994 [Gilbertella persicaria]
MNRDTSVSQRQAILMWWYSLSEQRDVDVVWAKVKREVENIQRMKTTNPRCLLDKMAVKLLNNFSNLSKDEIFVLNSSFLCLLNSNLMVPFYSNNLTTKYLFSCSCPENSKLCKRIFLVNRIFQVPLTQRSVLNTIAEFNVDATEEQMTSNLDNVASISEVSTGPVNNDDRIDLRFDECINEGKKKTMIC